MTTRDRKDVEKSLERKGFKRVESHHSYFFYWALSGKKTDDPHPHEPWFQN